jgi:hypothetical protein
LLYFVPCPQIWVFNRFRIYRDNAFSTRWIGHLIGDALKRTTRRKEFECA